MAVKIPGDTRVFKKKILFYGYDKFGYKVITEASKEPFYIVNFVAYNSSIRNLDEYDGIIIQSGIFENIPRDRNKIPYCSYSYDHEKLLDFERKLITFIRSGKWVVFLVDQMVPHILRNGQRIRDISRTDLAKTVLLDFSKWEAVYQGESGTISNVPEFQSYVESYGSAHTIFKLKEDQHIVPIVQRGDDVFGFHFNNQVFALPFNSSAKDNGVIQDVAAKVTEAVLSYNESNRLEQPQWIDNFTFSSEASLNSSKDELLEKLNGIDENLAYYKKVKSILASSGTSLEDTLVEIFSNFFGFEVKTDDKRLDDFQLLANGEVIISGEVKGVKGDIKRKYIGQLDANREEQGLEEDVKGLLIANCNNTLENMDERLNMSIPSNVKSFASKINITIIRTIELLHLMNFLEDKTVEERKEFFINEIMKYVGHVSIDSVGQVKNYKE